MGLHLSHDVTLGWPRAGTLPIGVRFAPSIARFPDDPDLKRGGAEVIWPDGPNNDWGRRILRDVPTGFDGLVMLDNEGPQHDALWAPLGQLVHPGRRKMSIAAMCRQVDACKRVRPKAAFGFYAVPSGGWYAPRMYEQTRRYGNELHELYYHVDVIMPGLYCPETSPGHERHADFVMEMAWSIARKKGLPLAPVVGTRSYSRGDDQAVLLGEDVLSPWMKVVMKYRPEHLIYWQNEPGFVRLLKEKALRRALTDDEITTSREEAARNLAWGLNFFRRYMY
ncbi:MAG TPA: hypothetical protein VFQ05_09755 [Candidatus Eisenbacteria bacterium]|nr:hypothetical protein [Candidatus Eisenbacteria bacterium]